MGVRYMIEIETNDEPNALDGEDIAAILIQAKLVKQAYVIPISGHMEF